MEKNLALVDCNNFFVSCERVFRPDLEGRPVIVLSSNDGCAIARSNEAKALGIRMGEPWFKVKDLPKYRDVVVFSSNFPLYSDLSNRVKYLLADFSPVQEVYSVDESFLDLTGFDDIKERMVAIRETVAKRIGIPVCVGVGPTKTLAKLANFVAKKHPRSKGVFHYNVLTEQQKAALLKQIPIDEVWGVGRRLNRSLISRGIETVYQLREADIRTMRSRYGVVMERLISELRGISCIDMVDVSPPKKQILSSRSFGELITGIDDLENAIAFHATKIGKQLRKQRSIAGMVHVFLMTDRFRQDKPQYHPHVSFPLIDATNSTIEINRYAMMGLHQIFKPGYEYKKAGACVSELSPESVFSPDMFTDPKRRKIMQVMDEINDRFGNGTLRLSQDDMMHRRWRPKVDRVSPRYTTSWDELAECS